MKRFALLVALLACSGGCDPATSGFDWRDHLWHTDRGIFAMDHVSGNLVDVTESVKRHYLGMTYHFESEDHARRFDAYPWSYLYSDNPRLSSRPDRMDQN